MRSSRLFALLLVIAGLIAGYAVAKFIHAPTLGTAATVVNIQLAALVWSLATLVTGLWLLRGWIARQWLRFTVGVLPQRIFPKLSPQALALRTSLSPKRLVGAVLTDGVLPQRGTPEYEACAQEPDSDYSWPFGQCGPTRHPPHPRRPVGSPAETK